MKTLEIKSVNVPFQIKGVDKKAGTFRGLSSTWDEDQGGDTLVKGAFARTLDHAKRGGRKIYLTDGHPEMALGDVSAVDRVLGKVTEAVETDEGLDTAFQMVPNHPKSALALDMIENDFLTGLSITYKAVPDMTERLAPTKDFPFGRRTIREVKLFSIGLVIHPMNSGSHASPASVKSLLDALRAGTLTDEDRAALLGLSDEHKAALRALLDAPAAPSGDSPAVTLKELAPDDPTRLALSARLRSLKRTQLVLT